MTNIKQFILFVLLMIAVFFLSFGFCALILKGICWAFGLAFSWKIALGVWLTLGLISGFIGGRKNG